LKSLSWGGLHGLPNGLGVVTQTHGDRLAGVPEGSEFRFEFTSGCCVGWPAFNRGSVIPSGSAV